VGTVHSHRAERGVGGQYFGRRKTQLCTLPTSNPLCLTVYVHGFLLYDSNEGRTFL